MKKILRSFLFAGTLSFTIGSSVLAAGQAPRSQPAPTQRPDTTTPDAANQTNADAGSRHMDDKKFVKDAAVGGMTEVELGKLAVQKASSNDVKQFGQKMVDDHTKANDQLKEIASKESIEVPSSLDPKHQARVDKLSNLSGDAFDKAYIKDQLKDHKQDVSEFKNESQNGSDPNIKQFASTTLPTLQEHLSMVEDLSKKSK